MYKRLRVFKNIMCIVLCFTLLYGCASNTEESSENTEDKETRNSELLDTLYMNFKEDNHAEAGEEIDPLSYVADYNGTITSTRVVPEEHQAVLIYRLSVENEEGEELYKDFRHTVEISDTKGPEIILNQDLVWVKTGKEADFSKVVYSVIDKAEGEEQAIEEREEGKGCYSFDDSLIDYSKEGYYTAAVVAEDSVGNESRKEFTVAVLKNYSYKVYYYVQPDWFQYGKVEYVTDIKGLLAEINEDLRINNGDVHNNSKDHYSSIEEFIEDGASYGQVYTTRYEIYDSEGNTVVGNISESEEKVIADRIYEYLIEKGYKNSEDYDEEFGSYTGFTVYNLEKSEDTIPYYVSDMINGSARVVYRAIYHKDSKTVELLDNKNQLVEEFELGAE